MIRIPARSARIASTLVAAAVLTAAFALPASDARQADSRENAQMALLGAVPQTPAASAEALFPDAPDGVDPMVTGPVSAEFRARQQQLGCERAEWPDIPAACYPN
jgi:hypothetical protein